MRCLKCGSYNVNDAIETGEVREPLFNRVNGVQLDKVSCNECDCLSTYRDGRPIKHKENGHIIKHNPISENFSPRPPEEIVVIEEQ